jgi:uncharacterized protein
MGTTKKQSAYDRALKQMQRKKPDLERAAILLADAAKRADQRAIYALGTWYLHGRHFKKNEQKDLRLIRKAARLGEPNALFDLAVSLERGIGIRADKRKAALTFLRCALHGGQDAAYEVGRCLYHGIGFPEDRLAAKEWYAKARVDRRRQGNRA